MTGLLGTITGQVRLDVRQAVAGYAALRAQNQRTIYAMRGTSEAMIATGRTMAVAGAGMVYAFAKVVGAAATFERKMDFAAAVTGATGKQMQRLSNYALRLGQNTIYSAGEIADGFIELAKAGVSVKDIIGGVGKAMANLGAAADIPLAESGQIITSTIQQYDLAARDAVHVTDLLAGAANASIADISDIGVSLKYVGGVANAAGLSLEDTTTAISLLAKAGIRGSTAGTSLRQMIVSLGGATGPAREALHQIGILTKDGSNAFYDMHGNLKPLNQVFQILQDHLDGYNAKERLAYLRTIFNNRALSAASILTREGAKGFKAMYREMGKTTAAEVAHKRLDNLSGDIEILRGNIETLMIKTGSPFQEMLRGWVQQLTRLIQAYGKLDPKTQQFIAGAVGATGVALLLMGALNIVIGTLFKFLAHLGRLGPALRFIGRMAWVVGGALLDGIVVALEAVAAAIGVTVGVLAIIVVAVAAFLAIWVLAYKKIEPFRKAVNAWYGAIWNAVKAIAAFIKLLATNPAKAWDEIQTGVSRAVNWVKNGFKAIPGLVSKGLALAEAKIREWAAVAIQWFAGLVVKIPGLVEQLMSRVIAFFQPANLGAVLGSLVGTAISWFVKLDAKIINICLMLTNKVIAFFAKLPGKVAYFIGFMVGRAIGLTLKMNAKITSIIARMIPSIIRFFAKLPGRIGSLISNMVSRSITLFGQVAQNLPHLASEAVQGVLSFMAKLPGRVASFIGKMVTKSVTLFGQLNVKAVQFASKFFSNIADKLNDLPSLMGHVIENMISAFTGAIHRAYEAAKDVASNLWEGFKDGIGMHSPSHIERAMWQITGTIDDETKKMARQVRGIQKMSDRLAQTQLTVGSTKVAPSSALHKYARLASMQSRNNQRAGTLLDAVGNDRANRRAVANAVRRQDRFEFVISNWHDGQGHFRRIAQDTIDDNAYYDDTLERMG